MRRDADGVMVWCVMTGCGRCGGGERRVDEVRREVGMTAVRVVCRRERRQGLRRRQSVQSDGWLAEDEARNEAMDDGRLEERNTLRGNGAKRARGGARKRKTHKMPKRMHTGGGRDGAIEKSDAVVEERVAHDAITHDGHARTTTWVKNSKSQRRIDEIFMSGRKRPPPDTNKPWRNAARTSIRSRAAG